MTHEICDRCDELTPAADLETVQVSMGRDYPGVGGGMCPPEYATLCTDCREAHAEEQAEQARAEQEADF